MEEIINILQNFSISEPETKLYLSSLKLGKASISDIAKQSKMGRTNAYFHINNLIDKGLLQESRAGKKIFVTAVQPTSLAKKLQSSVNVFKNLVPQLESLSVVKEDSPQIDILESKVGFAMVYDEIKNLPTGSEFRVIENSQTADVEMSLLGEQQCYDFFNTLVKKKIIAKALFSSELLADAKTYMTKANYNALSERMWNLRVLPEDKMPIDNLILSYGNKVAFLTPDRKLTVVIKESSIVNMINVMFEIIFGFAEKVEMPWQ